jgi:hypothetical protein
VTLVPRDPPCTRAALAALAAAVLAAGCATRAADVRALAADPAAFLPWTCERIHDEMDVVQQRAVQLSWIVDERAGQHVVALGIGLAVWWPALLAIRPDGAEAEALGHLKGRFEALQFAANRKGCAPPPSTMAPERAARLPVVPGERMVYEDRVSQREPLRELSLTMTALRRDEIEFVTDVVGAPTRWRQDLAGNVVEAPAGALIWNRLLRRPMDLGEVLAGELAISGDGLLRARVRGQVVAVGPQAIAGRNFDAAVIELYGDVPSGESWTRLDGAIVIDRGSGLLLRLDLRSAQPLFHLQRRLVRVEADAR